MKQTVEGIILNETNYGESSKILNILTKEYGYISVISKGCRTLKSKLRGISMKLIYANFLITYKDKNISVLHEGSVLNTLKYIMTDFKKMNYASYLIEITKSVLKTSNDKEIFEVLKNALLKINNDFNPSLISNIVEIKLLEYLGVKPNFSSCSLCGSTDILTFDFKIAGSVCKNCYKDSYLFTKNTLKLLKLFQIIDIKKIDKLNITSSKVVEELNLFTKEYYETFTGIYIKNKDNLNKNIINS